VDRREKELERRQLARWKNVGKKEKTKRELTPRHRTNEVILLSPNRASAWAAARHVKAWGVMFKDKANTA
jgi:hypothetical protein